MMTDIFRKEYKQIDKKTEEMLFLIKSEAERLLSLFERCEEDSNESQYDVSKSKICNRYMVLAKTNLEQSIMWAVKSIT